MSPHILYYKMLCNEHTNNIIYIFSKIVDLMDDIMVGIIVYIMDDIMVYIMVDTMDDIMVYMMDRWYNGWYNGWYNRWYNGWYNGYDIMNMI